MSSVPDQSGRAYAFLKVNQRPGKPRSRGITEIRGPYYTPLGKRQERLELTHGQADPSPVGEHLVLRRPDLQIRNQEAIAGGARTVVFHDGRKLRLGSISLVKNW